jgi:hypothetical protein
MPVLNQKSKVERIYLPSTKHLPEEDPNAAFVDMELGPLTAGDIVGIDPQAPEVESAVRMLAARIRGWNFTDAEGKELEVSYETVKLLDMEDFAHLAGKIPQNIEGLETAEKKT